MAKKAPMHKMPNGKPMKNKDMPMKMPSKGKKGAC